MGSAGVGKKEVGDMKSKRRVRNTVSVNFSTGPAS